MRYSNTIGLLGQGISYSLSPWIHNAAAQSLGISHRYRLFDLEAASVGAFLDVFWREGGVGLNITQPHKQQVARAVQSQLAAVNTLFRTPSCAYWQSLSTDGEGFLHALELRGWKETFPNWVFLGNGGAVLSILAAACNLNPRPRISILRRDSQKDGAFEKVYPGTQFFPFFPQALRGLFSQGPCLLVQATTALEEIWQPFHTVGEEFSGACMELNYGARVTSFFLTLREQGHPCEDGLAMLLEQARCSQKIWWGSAPSRRSLLGAMESLAPHYRGQGGQLYLDIQRLAENYK